jgi:hypothetical protein
MDSPLCTISSVAAAKLLATTVVTARANANNIIPFLSPFTQNHPSKKYFNALV